MKREPVFATREKEEEDLVEELLAEWDVPYDRRLDAFDDSGTVCHLSTVYDVDSEKAVEVRKALRAAGLADGIVEGTR
jgi:hypothetical protein